MSTTLAVIPTRQPVLFSHLRYSLHSTPLEMTRFSHLYPDVCPPTGRETVLDSTYQVLLTTVWRTVFLLLTGEKFLLCAGSINNQLVGKNDHG